MLEAFDLTRSLRDIAELAACSHHADPASPDHGIKYRREAFGQASPGPAVGVAPVGGRCGRAVRGPDRRWDAIVTGESRCSAASTTARRPLSRPARREPFGAVDM